MPTHTASHPSTGSIARTYGISSLLELVAIMRRSRDQYRTAGGSEATGEAVAPVPMSDIIPPAERTIAGPAFPANSTLAGGGAVNLPLQTRVTVPITHRFGFFTPMRLKCVVAAGTAQHEVVVDARDA